MPRKIFFYAQWLGLLAFIKVDAIKIGYLIFVIKFSRVSIKY